MSKKGFIAGTVFGGVAMAALSLQGADQVETMPQKDVYQTLSDTGTCRTLGINTDIPVLQVKWDEVKNKPYVQATTFADRQPAYNVMLRVHAMPNIGGEGCRRTDSYVPAHHFFMPHALLRDSFEAEYGKNRVAEVEQAVQALTAEKAPVLKR